MSLHRSLRLFFVVSLAGFSGCVDDLPPNQPQPDSPDAGGGGGGGNHQPVPSQIQVSPSQFDLTVDQTVTLTAKVLDQNQQVMNGLTVAWQTSDPAVAEVAAGVVRARKAGTVTISATVVSTVHATSQGTIAAAAGGGGADKSDCCAVTRAAGVNNFCLSGIGSCSATKPGGFCDPGAPFGDFNDADWDRGYNDFHDPAICAQTGGGAQVASDCCAPTKAAGKDNFCLSGVGSCSATKPGGYCDPGAPFADFNDADWVRGYNEFHNPNICPP